MDSKIRRSGRRSAQQARRTRDAILAAALRLFADRGLDPVSLRDIAEESSVSHGLIRHHFGTKEQVWQAVLDRADTTWLHAMSPALARARADPAHELEIVVRALTEATARHPQSTQLLITEGIRGGPRLRQIVERLAPLREALGPILAARQPTLDADELFLTVLLLAAGPFGLTGLTQQVTGHAPSASTQAELVLQLLT